MNISIFGGGISGMTAALILKNRFKHSKIKIFTKSVGGNFGMGGLKYLKYTGYTKLFMETCLSEIEYGVKNPIGAILADGNIHNFPLYMATVPWAFNLQKKYWIKTGRKLNEFDVKCMNDAFNFRKELSIDLLENSLDDFVDIMAHSIQQISTVIKVDFNLDLFKDVVSGSDIVIYTLPLSLLSKKIKKNLNTEFTAANLNIHKYGLTEYTLNKLWFDYLYVPGDEYKFHRLSIDRNLMALYAEINSDDDVDEDIENFLFKNFGFNYIGKINQINIKGQITKDVDINQVEKLLPKNVILLGRFAEWNKRITWDNVVEKLFTDKKLLF